MKWLLLIVLLIFSRIGIAQNVWFGKKPFLQSAYHYGDQVKYYDSLQVDFSQEYLKLSRQNMERIDAEEQLEWASSYHFDTNSIFCTINHDQQGVIGSLYRRIDLHISEVTATEDPLKYLVKGKSKVGENICDFTGTVTLLYLYEIIKNADVPGGGMLLAHYEFFEDSTQHHVGVFKGVFECDVVIDQDKRTVKFSDAHMSANGYYNRTYIGTWQGYNGGAAKKCIWGDFRLPFTFGFSHGAGNMRVSKRYEKYGWKSYNEQLYSGYVKNVWW